MKKIYLLACATLLISIVSCTDLDVAPKSSATANVIFNNPRAYEQFLARLYAGLAISGQQGPAGNPDIKGIDEGFSNYLRQYWKAQQLTTDETVIGWNDGTLPTYHLHSWTAQNEFVNAMFNRIYFQISMANEFLRESTDEKLDSRATTDDLRAQVRRYRAEAKTLRALSYWHGLDMFGSIPIVTEENEVGISVPDQSSREEVFAFIESQLKEAEPDLAPARQNQYGRADQGLAWMILSKLYLNAEVYIGQPKYTECVSYCAKIIDAGYQLDDNYQKLFMIGNENSPEIIFAVNFDGNRTQTYGGMTFLIHASIGGSMAPGDYGVNTGWAGLRATKNFVDLFPDVTGSTDSRAMFYTDGQTKEIPNTPISTFNEGYAVPKFRNLDEDGNAGSSLEFVDTDFPMFRLGDVYLMYAEAVERGGTGGSEGNSVNYINALRARAYGNNGGNISAADLTLDFLIDERARELYWEAHRRTDLIRFGLFSDSESANPRAIWPWKGGVAQGQETESFRDLFPLPSSQIIANPKLVQNSGY